MMSSTQPFPVSVWTLRVGQISLMAALIAVLTLLIVPLPHSWLDFFLGLNMLFAFTVLLVSVSIVDALHISALPTLLLLCTLFRLTLNVAATRLILGEGNAGNLIQAFGHYVTRGNIIVGLILFVILMLIQFIVIAKGSERVAEVAARFTLDAMPGKQMSIDADLRAGLILPDDAQARRDELLREARLYGALDGAMKFVKGETIAGFVILIVNLTAGFVIGVLQRDLDPLASVRIYSLLTVGEGLAAAVPALMVGLASGFILTKVGGRGAQPVGSEIAQQMSAHPLVLMGVALMAFLLSFVPAFPRATFMVLSVAAMGLGMALMLSQRRSLRSAAALKRHVVLGLSNTSAAAAVGTAWPLLVELGPVMYAQFSSDGRWRQCFDLLFPAMRLELSRETGVPFPDLKIAVNPIMPPEMYRIRIFEMTVEEGFLSPDHCVLRLSHDIVAPPLQLLEGESTAETQHGTPILRLNLHREEELRRSGYKIVPPEDMLLRNVARVLRRHAADYVGIQSVRDILTQVESQYPELVREIVPRLLSIQKLTDVVRRLVEEGISVRDFRQILEVLSTVQADTRDAVSLTELVRMGLRRQITQRHARADGRVQVFVLDPDLEEEIRSAIHREGVDTYLALAPERVAAVSTAFGHFLKQHAAQPSAVVTVVAPDIRCFVRKILENEFYELAVLSFQELEPSVIIEQKDVVSLNY